MATSTVICPMTSKTTCVSQCINCEWIFGYNLLEKVLWCKRGGKGHKIEPWITKKKDDENK